MGSIRRGFQHSDSLSSVILEHLSGNIESWNPVGQYVRSHADWVALNLPLRSPLIETVSMAAIDADGQIIYAEISSVGKLGEARFHTSLVKDSIDRARAARGDKVVAIYNRHNHPSGHSPASADDIRIVSDVAGELKIDPRYKDIEYLGHDITNGDEYTILDDVIAYGIARATGGEIPPKLREAREEGYPEDLSILTETRPLPNPQKAPWEVLPRKQLAEIHGAPQFQRLSSDLRQGDPGIHHAVYLNTKFRITMMERLQDPAGALTAASQRAYRNYLDHIVQGARNSGSNGVLLQFSGEQPWSEPLVAYKLTRDLREKGITLLDASSPMTASFRDSGMLADIPRGGFGGSLFEPRAKYELTKSAATDKRLRDTKVVDEDGRPKMVYRGVWGDPEKLGAAGGTRHPAPSFSEAPLIASIYAHEAVSPGSAPRVTPTYLALKNPVRFPVNEPVVTAATLRELLKPAGEYEEGLFREILNEAGEWVDPGTGEPGNYDSERPGMYVHNFEVANAPAFVKLARRKGFDGAMYKGMFSPMFLSGGAAHAEAWYGFDVFKFMKDQGVTRRQLNDWEDNGAWEYRPFDPGTQAVSPYDLKAGGLDELVKDSARRRYLREPQRSYGSSKRPPSGRTTPPEADPTFSSLRMDLPEAVWLAQMMNEGKIPAVRKMIARRNALGIARLSSATGTDTPAIELRADTAKIMTPEEIRQLKFEAFSWAVVQWGTRKANAGKTAIEEYQTNPKARDQINSLKAKRFSETLEKEKERLKFARSPVQAVSVILHEIGHWGDFLPTHILTRGNIFGHIAKLGRHLKGSINALPPGDQDLLSKADRQQVRKVARQQIRAEMGSQPKDEPDKSTWGDAVSERYGELLKAEHHDRGLFRLADLKPEMEEIMKWWNGWDPNLPPPEYFLKPEETYAELFSIFMNNEAAFRARAPLTWQLWQNHMVSHPPVHKLYSQLLNRLRTGTGGWRDARIRLLDGMADSDSRWHKLRKLERTLSWGEHLDALSLRFDRAQGPIMRRLDNAHRDPDQYGQVWKSIEDYLYRATAAEKFLTRATAEVQSLLVAANLDWPNLGEFMFHRRVINERFELYNTQGFDPKSSQAVLDEIKADDPHNFDVLLDAAKKYRSIYEEEVIPLLHGIFDQQIMTFIEDNVYYAPFMHPKGPDPKNWSIEEALKARYGDAVVPHIYKQIGSLENVMNPATALAMKAISLINMAHREKMKWEVTRFLADETLPWHKEVEKVEFRWKSEQMPREPRMRNDTRIGTVLGLRDGQVYGYYLPRAVADFLNTQPAQQVLLPIRAMNWATRGVKTLLVNANPGYWGYQITKDLRAFSKNMPGAALFGAHSFWEFAGPAWRAARASMKHREDPTSYMMLDRKVPITVANYKGMDTEDQAFERLQLRFHITPGTWNAKAKHPGVVAYDAWNRWVDTGQTLERWVKYAGMMYVDKYFPQMPEWEKLLIVHSQSGSPNFLHKGLWNQYTMFAMLFYNPWKEGWRREWQAFDRSHIGYSYRLARQTIMPKVAMAVAAAGGLFFLGKKAREEIRLMYASVSEYDMTNYLVLPLAWADRRQRKLLYFRMPLDEQERFISGILWKLMHPHQERGEGLLSYAGGQAPGPNPIVSVGVAWSLTASGINPPDPFRGDKVVPEQVWKADDHRAREEMLGWSSNQLGGGIIYRFSRDSWYEANPGRLERFLEAPVIGNTLGRWLKVSNKGIYDRVRPHVEDVQKLAERGHLDAKERLNDMLNDPSRKTLDALIKHVDENPQFGDYIDRVSDPMAGSRLGPEFRLLLNARTDAERLAIINTLEKYGIDFSLSEGLPAELERLTELPGSGGKRSSFKPSGAPSTMRLVPVPLKEPD